MKNLYILLFCIALIACKHEESKSRYENPYKLQFDSDVYSHLEKTDIPIHFNPNPQKVYEITISIKNSPSPLLVYKPSTLQFESFCKYKVGSVYSYPLTPLTIIKLPLTQIDENTYKLIFIQDAILDEDYGLSYHFKKQGICHWHARGAGVYLSPTGKEQARNILVNATDDYKTFDKQPSVQTFYFFKNYVTLEEREVDKSGFIYNGITTSGMTEEDVKRFDMEKSPDLFTITVSLKKLF